MQLHRLGPAGAERPVTVSDDVSERFWQLEEFGRPVVEGHVLRIIQSARASAGARG